MVILIILSIVGMALVGGMSIFAFTKFFGTMFLGGPRAKFKHEPSETSFIMHLPQYSIVVIMLTVALFPPFLPRSKCTYYKFCLFPFQDYP